MSGIGTQRSRPPVNRFRGPRAAARRLRNPVWIMAILAACSDPIDVTDPEVIASESSASTVNTNVSDLTAVPRFSLGIVVEPSGGAGQPIRITSRTTAHLATEQAEIRIILPELQAARATGFDSEFSVPVGIASVPNGVWTTAMTAGETQEHTIEVVIPREGAYRVVAAVRPLSDEPMVVDGTFVQDVAVHELWLDVSSGKTSQHTDFDASRVPNGFARQPGPYRVTRASRTPSNAQTQGAETAWFQALYHDPWGGYLPVRWAYYNVETWAGGPIGWLEDTFVGQSNQQGYVYVPCTDETHHLYGVVQTVGTLVQTLPIASAGIYGEAHLCGNSTPHQVFMDSDRGRVFDRMRETAGAGQQIFGSNRPQITVELTTGESNSFYRKNEDRIYIRADANPDHIWGSWGDFVIAHEYGHAYHHHAMGGINSNSSDNCSPHYLASPSSLGCALAEGFADYFAAVAGNSDIAAYESNAYYYGGDGSVIEGAVAAFLYDLTDAANEPHDVVQYPGSYLAEVFQTCKAYDPIPRRANGIDHLVYCMENQVDPVVTQTYFPTRGTPPYAFLESASEPPGWSSSDVRTLWEANLYGQ